MDNTIQLYTFIRGGASIYIARIEEVTTQPGPIDQHTIALKIRVEQTLWGETTKEILRSQFTQPDNEIARLKFPHPIWGRVDPREGSRLFLVTHEPEQTPLEPVYVEEIVDPGDVVLSGISDILSQEKPEQDPAARKARYLAYLAEGETVERLFGAEALAKDRDLPEIDQTGQVATAMAAVFISDATIYVRISVGTWMWENIYPRTSPEGKVAVINATIKGTEDSSEDIRRFSRDYLSRAGTADLLQTGVRKSSEAASLMQEQLELETSPEVRAHLQKLIDVLRS
jgi:hypothetical protein